MTSTHLGLDLRRVCPPLEHDGGVVAALLSPELHVLPVRRREAVHALRAVTAAFAAYQRRSEQKLAPSWQCVLNIIMPP